MLAALPRSTAASKNEPVYQEIPGLTAPAPKSLAQATVPVTNQPPPTVEPAPVVPPPSPVPQTSQPTNQTPGKTLYAFTANALDLRAALATFARANNLNIVPDNDIVGTVTVDVRDLPLQQMMRALLEASDCTWQEEGGLIRVRNTETRTFIVDYLRMARNGKSRSSATLNSATAGGGGQGGGGQGGGRSGGAGGSGGG